MVACAILFVAWSLGSFTDSLDSLNLGVVLGVMQIAKRVPFDNPDVLNAVRAMYLASNLIILAIYYTIHSKINKKKGTCGSHGPRFGLSSLED